MSSAPHFQQATAPSSVMQTEGAWHRAQAAAGSVDSGGGSGGAMAESAPPAGLVAGSKVAPHSPQTWLKQQSVVQV